MAQSGDSLPRIGLISDTHGLLRPEAVRALAGVDTIVHAGDVGDASILEALGEVAPVTAVRGNIDRGAWADVLPQTAVVAQEILVIHDVAALPAGLAAAGYRVVVSGHSHKPGRVARDGVLYVNPGAAGPRRFRLPVSVAILEGGAGDWRVEFIDLTHDIGKKL